MQGQSGGRGARVFAILAASHIGAAALTTTVAAGLGSVAIGWLPSTARIGAWIAVAVGLAGCDLWSTRRKDFACGLRRQTPRMLLQDTLLPWWVVPVVWGSDTGTLLTTFRVTHASWAIIAAAFLGIAPPWIGAVAGSTFIVPLVVSARLALTGHVGRAGSDVIERSQRTFQAASCATLVLAAVVGGLDLAG